MGEKQDVTKGNRAVCNDSLLKRPANKPQPQTFEQWYKQEGLISSDERRDSYHRCWAAAQLACCHEIASRIITKTL